MRGVAAVCLLCAMWISALAGVAFAGVGDRIADDAVTWSKEKTHFLKGSHGDPCGHSNINYLSGRAWRSDQGGNVYYCLSYAGIGSAGDSCSPLERHHFDCVGFICQVFRDVGIDQQYLGTGTQDCVNEPYEVTSLGPRLAARGWKWQSNPSLNDGKCGDPLKAFDYSWATLHRGDILIFAGLQKCNADELCEKTDASCKFSWSIADDNHSAICVVDSSNASGPSMVSCRAGKMRKSNTGGNCVDPNDSGVICEPLADFLAVGKDQFLNPGNYVTDCMTKGHAFLGYFTLDDTPPTTLICSAPLCSCDGNADVSATLTSNGLPLAGKSITFILDGSTTTAKSGTTNAKGVASASFGPLQSLGPGLHTFYAVYEPAPGDNYLGSQSDGCEFDAPWNTQIKVNVTGSTCGSPLTITATLKRESDTRGVFSTPVPNAVVAFTAQDTCRPDIQPTKMTVATDASGVATIIYTPDCADNYKFSAHYAGDPNACYCPSDGDASVSIFTTIKVTKFKDCNMNGVQDAGEPALAGWPVKLTGSSYCTGQIAPVEQPTGLDGTYTFTGLQSGKYVVSEEGSGIVWEKNECCDLRTTWLDRRWQFTAATLDNKAFAIANCAVTAPAVSVDLCCSAIVTFGNVPLSTVTAFKFHDLNMNGTREADGEPFVDLDGNHYWTDEEPYTDANCNGVRDGNEYYYDRDKDKQWDAAEPFTDLDGDGRYDYPECVIGNWPIRLSGLRADGKPLCLGNDNILKTDPYGNVVFSDVPPSDATGYTLSEAVNWCKFQLPTGEWVHRATYPADGDEPLHMDCTYPPCDVTRWQAVADVSHDALHDLDIQRTFVLPCEQTHHEDFCNICLSTVSVTKNVYEGGAMVKGQETPGAGWEIALAGTDPRGLDVVPSKQCEDPKRPDAPPCCGGLQAIGATSPPPLQMACRDYSWYDVKTDGDGHATFYDLLPGHYHLMEQPRVGYRMGISEPSMCGFDMICCPREFTISNLKIGVPIKVYQAYPGTSDGANPVRQGYRGNVDDVTTALPGVLAMDPGKNWENFKQAAQLCLPTPPKTTILTKTFSPFAQCADVFRAVSISQLGTPSIRTWWPLMYEPPTTTWDLRLVYGSGQLLQLPGETRPGWVHQDEWKWTVDTDIPHMKLYLDLLHELPFGNDEVPLISDEPLLDSLQAQLSAVQAAVDAADTANAGLLLGDFELMVMDACIGSSPAYPNVTGPGTGIANTDENPACCKLLVDTEYVGKKVGAFQQAK